MMREMSTFQMGWTIVGSADGRVIVPAQPEHGASVAQSVALVPTWTQA
jgi:hypothetical protein